ncbi:MAG: metallophosphoesterase [Proteiniphilum sp.]|nr:metallophosphoesterase [Proteiniphilum sp.]
MTDPDFLSAPFRVVVMHIPPTGSTWHGTLDLAAKYLPALNSAKIDIMLCGHTHNYKRHGVPVTFLLYPTGGHGFGNLNTFTYKHQFMQELATWLEGL